MKLKVVSFFSLIAAVGCQSRNFSDLLSVSPQPSRMSGRYYSVSYERRYAFKVTKNSGTDGRVEVYERINPQDPNSTEELFAVFPQCVFSASSTFPSSDDIRCGDAEIVKPSQTRPTTLSWSQSSVLALKNDGKSESSMLTGGQPASSLRVYGALKNGDPVDISSAWCFTKDGESYCRSSFEPRIEKAFDLSISIKRDVNVISAAVVDAAGHTIEEASKCGGESYVDMPGDTYRFYCSFKDMRILGSVGSNGLKDPKVRPNVRFSKIATYEESRKNDYREVDMKWCAYDRAKSNLSRSLYVIKCNK